MYRGEAIESYTFSPGHDEKSKADMGAEKLMLTMQGRKGVLMFDDAASPHSRRAE